LMEILICTPIILFCKIFIPNYIFDALLWWNWPFSLPSRVTLQITNSIAFCKKNHLVTSKYHIFFLKSS
jgi:ABC-type multidrug transport system permease subunit